MTTRHGSLGDGVREVVEFDRDFLGVEVLNRSDATLWVAVDPLSDDSDVAAGADGVEVVPPWSSAEFPSRSRALTTVELFAEGAAEFSLRGF